MKKKLIIQRLRNLSLKVHIHFLTFVYFILAWLGGYLKWYLSTLLIVCLHEICHLLMAYYFHFRIQKIEVLPFGAYLVLDDFYFHSILHEMCVVLAGPCSHLLIYEGIVLFSEGVYQQYLLTMNMFVFLFNLLPIYPLDGSRFLCLLLQSVMDLKRALWWNLKISVLMYCLLLIFYLQSNTVVILSYLFYQIFHYHQFIYTYLRQYYSKIPSFSCHRPPIIQQRLYYRRGYHNYYQIHSQIIDEKEMVPFLLKSIKK